MAINMIDMYGLDPEKIENEEIKECPRCGINFNENCDVTGDFSYPFCNKCCYELEQPMF